MRNLQAMPRHISNVLIFFRGDMFYPIDALPGIDLKQQAKDHAECNPGTLRVEDVFGNVLWQPAASGNSPEGV